MASTATKNTKKEIKKKICLACPQEDNQNLHPLSDFYASKNPMHKDGKVPWCKSCIKKYSLSNTGEIDEDKFKSVLRQIDRPYYKDVLQSAINQYNKELYMGDDTHPNANGYALMGEKIAKFINSN